MTVDINSIEPGDKVLLIDSADNLYLFNDMREMLGKIWVVEEVYRYSDSEGVVLKGPISKSLWKWKIEQIKEHYPNFNINRQVEKELDL